MDRGAASMFSRRMGEPGPRRFWSWFSAEAQGLSNGLEALARGEADAERLLVVLNARIRRYDPAMQADLVRAPDGACELRISGGPEASAAALLAAAPITRGWRVIASETLPDLHRVPFRRAPQPSLDLASPIEARHEAYA